MEPIITKLAISAASQIAKPITNSVGKRACELVLGPEEQRALDKVNRRAMHRAAEAVLERASAEDVAHVLALLELLVSEQQRTGNPFMIDESADFTRADALGWRSIAMKAGLDIATFPADFDILIVTLLSSFKSELEAASKIPGSPLFSAFLLTEISQLQADLKALLLTPAQSQIARSLAFDPALAEALDAAQARAQLNNRAILTPDLLNALLTIRTGSSRRVFEAVETGLAEKTQHALARFFTISPTAAYSPIEWTARRDVRLAQDFAWLDGQPSVSEPYLLCAVLKTRSNTQLQLREWLGPRYRLLCGFAAEARATHAPPVTPYIDFMTEDNND